MSAPAGSAGAGGGAGTGAGSVRVLYEDEHILAIDKPPGRLVIPGRGRDEQSLVEELSASNGRLWVVHRLDRGTSGVLVFARSAEAHRSLNVAFDRGEPRKRYLALVTGAPPDEQRIDVAIAPARRGRMRPARPGDLRGKPSATVVRVLERFPPRPWSGAGAGLALVEALPETGRTHQIRVHLAHVGHPLALDPDYGPEEPVCGPDGEPLLSRTPLHAQRLMLAHPSSGAPLMIEAPLPGDLGAALAVLRGG